MFSKTCLKAGELWYDIAEMGAVFGSSVLKGVNALKKAV